VDVLTQIGAATAALDRIALGLLDGHMRTCLLGEGEGPETPDTQADEVMAALGRMLSR
jgi:DNA-binding FrmR family transcriptional regulator